MTDTAVRPLAELVARAEADYAVWLSAILPEYCTARLAPHHARFWEWVWSIEQGRRAEPFVGIWARGGAKSTSAESACVALGARKARRYGLYVCDTQDRADDHVGTVGSMLESERVELFYPAMAAREVGKYGDSKGWRRNRLRTASGFILDAIGLDVAARGVKIKNQRPDFMVFDDIDGQHDTAATTERKVRTITKSLLPAGADDVVVLAIQNLVIPEGVFAQLADGRAEFLRRRIVSGPVPAIEGLVLERGDDGRDVIASGTATWEGQDLATCQANIDDWGTAAFLEEAQHEVEDAAGALWCAEQINEARVTECPPLAEFDQRVVSVDPSGGKGKGHDTQGIVAVGRIGGLGYVLADATPAVALSAAGWGRRAIEAAVDVWADEVIVEENYGGDSMDNTLRTAARDLVAEERAKPEPDESLIGFLESLPIRAVSAKLSKKERAKPVSALYGQREKPETWPGRVRHVGVLAELEREMRSWEPDVSTRSPNRVDALVHGIDRLGIGVRGTGRGGLQVRRAA